MLGSDGHLCELYLKDAGPAQGIPSIQMVPRQQLQGRFQQGHVQRVAAGAVTPTSEDRKMPTYSPSKIRMAFEILQRSGRLDQVEKKLAGANFNVTLSQDAVDA